MRGGEERWQPRLLLRGLPPREGTRYHCAPWAACQGRGGPGRDGSHTSVSHTSVSQGAAACTETQTPQLFAAICGRQRVARDSSHRIKAAIQALGRAGLEKARSVFSKQSSAACETQDLVLSRERDLLCPGRGIRGWFRLSPVLGAGVSSFPQHCQPWATKPRRRPRRAAVPLGGTLSCRGSDGHAGNCAAAAAVILQSP